MDVSRAGVTSSHRNPDDRRPRPIVEALLQLENDLHREIAAIRERAERAEAELARSQEELARITARYEAQCRTADERLQRLGAGMRDYLDVTGETQQTLLDLTRQLLTVKAESGGPAAAPRSDPGLDQLDAFAPLHDEHVTDEHRLIDLRNRLDMERLDTPSRLATPMRRWRVSPTA